MIYSFLDKISNFVGMVGVVFLLLAYFLLNTNKVSSQSLKYLTFNLVGAILIFYSLLFHFNFSSVVIEIVWIIISCIGIAKSPNNNKVKVKY